MATATLRILVAVMAMAAVAELAMAVNYDVGDTDGWTLGVDYTNWVADKKFLPGDNITFTYSSTSHDVVEINAADYAACSASNPINTFKTGKTIITLEGIGKRYFLCSKGNHCAQGMKVEIDVVAAASKSPSPSPSSSPPGVPTSPADTPTSTSGSPPSKASPPAPSAAAGSTYVQAKVALGLGMLAAAAFGLVIM